MNTPTPLDLSHTSRLIQAQENSPTNPGGDAEFLQVARARLNRRSFLRGSGGTATAALLGGVGLGACGGDDATSPVAPIAPTPPLASTRITTLNFAAVAKSRNDVFSVPTGYSAKAIYGTGDPITSSIGAYSNTGTDDPATYDRRSGDCHDGVEYFGLTDAGALPTAPALGNSRGLLAMNHEYITPQFLHPTGPTTTATGQRPAAEVDREVAMHGVSVVEVWKQNAGAFASSGSWAVNSASALNRRITAATRIELAGPGRNHPAMATKYSPTGTHTRGTVNNCGTGISGWGTLLTCEENWAGYFTRNSATDNPLRSAKEVTSLNRYAVGGDRYRWGTLAASTAAAMAANAVGSKADSYDRWNANILAATADQDYRNAANTYGWVVEIDPYDPLALPKKRTAMGRFAHEAAVANAPVVGQPLALYMGDDSRGDYIYKFVSAEVWAAADAYPSNRMAVGDKYLDSGTLFVARFNADGTGSWLPLTLAAVQAAQAAAGGAPAHVFADAFDVLLNARLAGDALRATRMDRPEWGAVNPATREIYFTLTENNSSAANPASGQSGRRLDNLDAANPRLYADAREATTTTAAGSNTGNPFGHIIRLREEGQNPAATAFTWDVFLFGAQADADASRVNLSGLSSSNDFARADGLWFSSATGLCWIQTDDSGAFLDQSNCMMLAAVAGSVGDGTKLAAQAASTTASGSTPAGAALAATAVGKPMSETTLKRFLVGPRDQEITGVTETPDGKTLFVNVQHPGEDTPAAAVAAGAGDYNSYWPGAERAPGSAANAAGPRPRSGTVVITKNDGGLIGS
jgi:uncharacterized protein